MSNLILNREKSIHNCITCVKPLTEWIKPIFNSHHPQTFFFRVDAGCIPGLSFGHLTRCLTLSNVFRKIFRSENIFLMRSYIEGVNHAVYSGEIVKQLTTEPNNNFEKTTILNLADEFKPEWFIIDLPYPDIDTSYFPILKKKGIKILFIDDARFINPGVDVLFNSNILAPQKIKKDPDSHTQYFLGPEFFIFDDSLTHLNITRKDQKLIAVITLGGSDPTGLTRKILEALILFQWSDVLFRVILGPGYTKIDYINFLVKNRKKNFEVVINPSNIIPFFQECDFAICAGGRTMYELLYLKKQFLPIASTKHESESISSLINQGILQHGMTQWQSEKFKTQIISLLNDKSPEKK